MLIPAPLRVMSVSSNDKVLRLIIVVLLMFFIGLQYRLWIGQGSWEEIVSLEKDIEQQQTTNERLQSRNQILENEVKDLKSGKDSVEERARSELGLIKEGETLYILADKKNNPPQ